MRITLTVVTEHGHRDVVVEGDEATTVAGLAAALDSSSGRPSNVVRLPRARAPYDLDRGQRTEPAEAKLWLDGRPLDPDSAVFGLLRDGDLIAVDGHAASATMMEEPGGVVELRVVGGPGAGVVHRLGFGTHIIGADPACAIAVPDPLMPARAAVIRLTPSAITVEPADMSSGSADRSPSSRHASDREGAARGSGGHGSGGLHLDGEPVIEATPWPERATLSCGGSAFSIGPVQPPDAHLDALPDGGLAYNRPPRLQRPDRQRRIVVPAEPKRAEGMRLQLLAALLPAVFGIVMVRVTGQWYFLLIALMTPLIMLGQWAGDRRHGRKKHRQAVKAYKERLAAYETEVTKAVKEDEAERRNGAPDPAEVLLTATGPRRRLWERRIHDRDALRLRVGLADLPADLDFEPESGAPADSPRNDQPLCRDVPVALVMRRLGVAGLTGPRDVALGSARWLVGQAATLHSPRDLAIVVLSANADSADQWGWVRWLPHCASDAASRGGSLTADCVALVGADPEAAARRVSELAALVAERLDTDGTGGTGGGGPYGAVLRNSRLTGGPAGWEDLGRAGSAQAAEPAFATYDERPYDVLVILDGAQVLRGLPGMPQVLRQGPRAGVYTIAIDEDERLLPEECATVVSCGRDGSVRLRGGGLDPISGIRADRVSPSWADRLGRALAPLRDVSRDDPSSALPDSVRLLDLLGPVDIAKQWGRSTRAVIGVGPEGPFEVDISKDGPHALIAGTTGAGKSELLQTLICSLAVANRPDEMTFVLIDYKGGAAFKECVRLPHTVGMVSDLDGHLTQRALSSLAAEIRRRERLLLDAGAKDIDDYQRLRARGATWVLGVGGVRQARTSGIFGSPGTGSPSGFGPGASFGGSGSFGRSGGAGAGGAGVGGAGAGLHSGGRHPSLPRLVLIIDEFAALVAELPDFVEGLVDIARRGRSLGIHLILATQRPGGVVTADIQANTSLRIALRVTDGRESADVIDVPDAAHISRSTPGRCYVRSGSGPAVAVQTARIGGRTPSSGPGSGGPGRGRAVDGPHHGGDGPRHIGARHAEAGRGGDDVRVIDLSWQALGHPLEVSARVETSADTDLALLVDAIVEAGRGIPRQPSPWLPPLSDRVTLDDLPEAATGPDAAGPETRDPGAAGPGVRRAEGTGWTASPAQPYRPGAEEVPPLPFGIADLPWEQGRRPLVLDPRHGGHLLIAGTARSGRSTALRTIAGSIAAGASPEDVHIHAVDCGSGALLPLVGLPHCGAVVTRDQLDRVERLLTRLRAEVGRRQQLLAEAGYASLAEARAAARSHLSPSGAGRAIGPEVGRLPYLVLMVDRWEGYVAAFENYDYGRLLDALMQLLREGPAVGLRAVVTSDRSGLLGQISTVFEDRLILRLADPADYGLAGLPVRTLPTSMPPGRTLSIGEHGLVESQIALLADDPSGPAQVAALQELGRTATARFGGDPRLRGGLTPGGWAWESEPPLRVDALPMRITADQALELAPSFEPPSPLWALLGAGGDALAPLGVDLLAQGPAAVVAGPARSGRSSCLVTAARSLLQRGTPILAVTPRRSPLRELAGSPGVLAVLDGNARSVDGGGADDFGGLPGAHDPLALVAGQERYVLIVDDAELISPESMLGLAVEEALRTARDGEHGLLLAGTTGDLATAYRGFVAEARKSRTGLLLAVQSPADGDLFNVRLPRGAVGGPPGRGLLVVSGTATPIQAAIPG
ncbi:FtsK/SpoIIIE domain-containing protein [Planotetraspora sp. A-T 1434]|uniref:FtsK/SpoIIIE domain-containing protein n=1 Tax=Planotetraspora sp. A-T 1434 TaxID=2979219 RepID=UPI0021BEA784|nr:FtsK/SpoIIIE domain-containing protein [Planotetraspora sp. A-T 1434]MCT9928755.1 FtsK/SpoIIIE domain-containing protein [Planotetraspora sp. A-T 1434]